MNFRSFSPSADQAKKRFREFASQDPFTLRALLGRSAALCPSDVVLVTPEEPDRRILLEENAHILLDLFRLWQIIRDDSSDSLVRQEAWRGIMQYGEAVFPKNQDWMAAPSPEPRLFRFRGYKTKSYFLLLTGLEQFGLPIRPVYFLINLWHIEEGNLPIHSAGVLRRGKVFLFTGPSGSGKSTIASLSGDTQIIDDDQIYICHTNDGMFTVDVCSCNDDVNSVPLQAIFALVQDVEDRLVPLRQMDCVRVLLIGHLDIMGELSSDLLRVSFANAAKIARTVPGYELHFRKSPNFWKLIDEQFPD